jgi:hypothetical protein
MNRRMQFIRVHRQGREDRLPVHREAAPGTGTRAFSEQRPRALAHNQG